MTRRILFVTYGGGHAHMVYPVVHALRASKERLEVSVLGLTAAREILKRNGVESFGFSAILDPIADADAITWGTELSKEHHSEKSGAEPSESIAYLGLSFKDLVIREGEAKARQLLKEKGRHAFFPEGVMKRIFERVCPDFVVTTSSPRSEAAAIANANEQGIRNLAMTDLFSGIADYKLRARNITFLSPLARDMWVANGFVDPSISKLHITGNPAFDRLLSSQGSGQAGWIQKEFPGAKNAVALHADAPAYWDPSRKREHLRNDKEILEEMDAVYRATIDHRMTYLVRPHPSQPDELYEKWLKGKPDAFLASKQDLYSLLRNITVLVVRTSTVGLEAAYLGKAVLQLDSDFHTDMPLAKLGVAWGANSFAEISSVMRGIISSVSLGQGGGGKSLPREPAAAKIAHIITEALH
jgi:hypothetical protein